MPRRGGYGDYGMKDSWDKVFGHSYESCKSPRQIESENEMIIISQPLFLFLIRRETYPVIAS